MFIVIDNEPPLQTLCSVSSESFSKVLLKPQRVNMEKLHFLLFVRWHVIFQHFDIKYLISQTDFHWRFFSCIISHSDILTIIPNTGCLSSFTRAHWGNICKRFSHIFKHTYIHSQKWGFHHNTKLTGNKCWIWQLHSSYCQFMHVSSEVTYVIFKRYHNYEFYSIRKSNAMQS